MRYFAVAILGIIGSAAAANDSLAIKAYTILEASCFQCHAEKEKGGLNITSRERILEGGDQGPAVDPANLAASLLLDMLSYRDQHHQMPPSGKLPDDQIALLTEWVLAGAPWPEGAAAVPAQQPAEVHTVDGSDHWAYQPVQPVAVPEVPGAENAIDAFILDTLAEHDLELAPPAEPRALIRRVYYDLTGLPPTPEAVEAFAADPSDAAYEALIDELLASPHYGEKWGRFWLDLVRYADSNGYERDSDKPFMWRYRDYVIDAFNADKPYDQFIREQLAGDELDEPTPETITATGYYRVHVWDDEPADPEQSRYDNLDDVIATTSQVFLGMTIGCARCHDHKIDPISQKDYFQFLAFVENITPITREQVTRSIMTAPAQAEYDAKVRAKEAKLNAIREDLFTLEAELFEALAPKVPEALNRISDLVDLQFRFYRDTWTVLPNFDSLRPEDTGALKHNFVSLAPASRRDSFGFVYDARLRVPTSGEYTFTLRAQDGARLIVDGHEVLVADGLGAHEASGTVTLELGFAPFRLEYFHGPGTAKLELAWSGPGFSNRTLTMRPGDGGSMAADELLDKYQDTFTQEQRDLRAALKEVLKTTRETAIPGDFATTVAEYGPEAPKTHIHIRGNAHVMGDEVSPGFPSILNPPEPNIVPVPASTASTGRRRALAEWIASDDNPLTARVIVNRIWQGHFGRGIVGTPNDFGLQGDMPTHPELLDWLAQALIANDWRIKPLHKTIMMSRTYRASSRPSEAALARDPENRYYARFDMRRLTAEEIRDSMLAIAGTLNLTMGGPGFYPQLPAEVLATSSMAGALWRDSSAEERNRRSIYIHTKRSLLHPLLTDFDLADTDNTCPVRFATTQPTQALNMLNSEDVNNHARALAARLRSESNELETQIRRAWHLVTGRPATDAEINRSTELIATLTASRQLDPDAALERFCLVMLNLNEFLFLD